jgi:hypothetical protein
LILTKTAISRWEWNIAVQELLDGGRETERIRLLGEQQVRQPRGLLLAAVVKVLDPGVEPPLLAVALGPHHLGPEPAAAAAVTPAAVVGSRFGQPEQRHEPVDIGSGFFVAVVSSFVLGPGGGGGEGEEVQRRAAAAGRWVVKEDERGRGGRGVAGSLPRLLLLQGQPVFHPLEGGEEARVPRHRRMIWICAVVSSLFLFIIIRRHY